MIFPKSAKQKRKNSGSQRIYLRHPWAPNNLPICTHQKFGYSGNTIMQVVLTLYSNSLFAMHMTLGSTKKTNKNMHTIAKPEK